MNNFRRMAGLFCGLLAGAGALQAQPASAPVERRELIYCAGLMTHAEREAYRAKMRSVRDDGEKAALRAAHRAEMQQRAAARGLAGECETAGRQWRGGREQ